ncbi:non-specific lipid-transfer protein-like [Andrographis paniculata]|uniref:non-specific lipid-transfer protein-like n=1 Tax=Andrographis paniculata TaxID=175694 RepID=UPI0021E85F10|nr:non-specific lipid-transfer protein-like [Andrographis paniculata]
MAAGKTTFAILMAVALIASAIPRGEAAISCGAVASAVSQCIGYLTGPGTTPPAACCGGIRSLNAAARTTGDRQAACNCLKKLGAGRSGLVGKAAGLPGKCGVNVGYPISTNVDCSRVR